MSISTSKLAYEDCYDILDRALNAPSGIRVAAETRGQAVQLLTRLNYARTLERELSKEIHHPESSDYNVSQYDTLQVRRPREEDSKWWIYIVRRGQSVEIEELEASGE